MFKIRRDDCGLYASEHFEEAAQEAVREYSRRKGKPGVLTVRQAFPDKIFGGELYLAFEKLGLLTKS